MPSHEVELLDPRCPETDTLAAFGRGELSLSSLEALAGHVSACPTCSEVVAAVAHDDRLALDLRRHLRGTPPVGRAAKPRPGEPDDLPRPPEAGLPRRLGRYELLETVGQGAMGVVYRARQAGLNRIVAVKVARFGLLWSSEASARLRTECEAIARLRHENIVQVHEFDEADGVPFFSMEYLPGGTLAARLAAGPLPEREAAALVQCLAEGVHYAHEKQVIHRDLKPSNVLVAADGTPKIADFGLAKVLDADGTGITQTDAILGTPSYMAPEQATGRSAEVGPPTDVYALGAILYEAITGGPPFRGDTKHATLQLVTHVDPQPPRTKRPDVQSDLEAICLKCLEKHPARRYTSARALADDLDRWLGGGRPRHTPGWFRRAARALRRRGGAVLAGSLAVCVGLTAAVLYPTDPDRPRRDLEDELARGRPVALVGEVGGPKWFEWRTGGGRGRTGAAPGGFTVQTWDVGLLELLADPQTDRFRFAAQVRHEKSDRPGSVGLYVARRAYPGQQAHLQFFTRVVFNDVWGAADLAPENALVAKRPSKPNVVRLGLHLHSELDAASCIDWPMGGPDGPKFEPAGEDRGGWHDVAVTVTPERVTAHWDGQAFGMTVDSIRQRIQSEIPRLRSRYPDDPSIRIVQPGFDPRGGVGLFVMRGSASFRSVSVVPWAESN